MQVCGEGGRFVGLCGGVGVGAVFGEEVILYLYHSSGISFGQDYMDPVAVSYARWWLECVEHLASMEQQERRGVDCEGYALDGLGHIVQGGVGKGGWEEESAVRDIDEEDGDGGRVACVGARNARHIWGR